MARSKGVISYKEHTLHFHPDVSAEVHRKQRDYDGVRQKLRERGIGKHRIIYPARLLLTHQEKSRAFDTQAAVKSFIEELDTEYRWAQYSWTIKMLSVRGSGGGGVKCSSMDTTGEIGAVVECSLMIGVFFMIVYSFIFASLYSG